MGCPRAAEKERCRDEEDMPRLGLRKKHHAITVICHDNYVRCFDLFVVSWNLRESVARHASIGTICHIINVRSRNKRQGSKNHKCDRLLLPRGIRPPIGCQQGSINTPTRSRVSTILLPESMCPVRMRSPTVKRMEPNANNPNARKIALPAILSRAKR